MSQKKIASEQDAQYSTVSSDKPKDTLATVTELPINWGASQTTLKKTTGTRQEENARLWISGRPIHRLSYLEELE
jgi:hypothetical protein